MNLTHRTEDLVTHRLDYIRGLRQSVNWNLAPMWVLHHIELNAGDPGSISMSYNGVFVIRTRKSDLEIWPGDYICKNSRGSIYAVTPGGFEHMLEIRRQRQEKVSPSLSNSIWDSIPDVTGVSTRKLWNPSEGQQLLDQYMAKISRLECEIAWLKSPWHTRATVAVASTASNFSRSLNLRWQRFTWAMKEHARDMLGDNDDAVLS